MGSASLHFPLVKVDLLLLLLLEFQFFLWFPFLSVIDPRFPLLSNGTNSSYFVGLLGEVKDTGRSLASA